MFLTLQAKRSNEDLSGKRVGGVARNQGISLTALLVNHHCIGHFMTPRKEGTKQSKEIALEDRILLRSRVQSCYHGV